MYSFPYGPLYYFHSTFQTAFLPYFCKLPLERKNASNFKQILSKLAMQTKFWWRWCGTGELTYIVGCRISPCMQGGIHDNILHADLVWWIKGSLPTFAKTGFKLYLTDNGDFHVAIRLVLFIVHFVFFFQPGTEGDKDDSCASQFRSGKGLLWNCERGKTNIVPMHFSRQNSSG